MSKYYTTKNLNEVLYLKMHNISPISVRTTNSNTLGMWKYHATKEQECVTKDYFTGSPKVDLHRWNSLRRDMKYELHHNEEYQTGKNQPSPFNSGTPYFFVNGAGNVQQGIYGFADVHKERIQVGNFYINKSDAENAARKTS